MIHAVVQKFDSKIIEMYLTARNDIYVHARCNTHTQVHTHAWGLHLWHDKHREKMWNMAKGLHRKLA